MRERMAEHYWWLQWARAWNDVTWIYYADCMRGRR
jgi:hypothetical protein